MPGSSTRKVLDSGLGVTEFELQSHYNVHFYEKIMNPIIRPSYVINSITDALLQGYLW